MFIQNVSMDAIKSGNHVYSGEHSMLIQIVDPTYEFPTPFNHFEEIHRFEFLDVEYEGSNLGEFAITDFQAEKIIRLLKKAFADKMSVVVHCHAGVCRSGAVVEAGIQIGFEDTGKHRSPNILVKKKLFKVLGLAYDSSTLFQQPIWD